MDTERQREALRLLAALQSVAPEERAAWLDEHCVLLGRQGQAAP